MIASGENSSIAHLVARADLSVPEPERTIAGRSSDSERYATKSSGASIAVYSPDRMIPAASRRRDPMATIIRDSKIVRAVGSKLGWR